MDHWWHTGQHNHSSPSLQLPWHLAHSSLSLVSTWPQIILLSPPKPLHLKRIIIITNFEKIDVSIAILTTVSFQLLYFWRLIDLSSITFIFWRDNIFVFQVSIRSELTEQICHSLRKFKWRIYHQLTGINLSKNDNLYHFPYPIHGIFSVVSFILVPWKCFPWLHSTS